MRAILDRSEGGEFSIRPQQGEVRAVFVPLARLQQDLEQKRLVNAMLISERGASTGDPFPALLKRHARVEDYGLSLRTLDDQQTIALETSAGFIDAPRAEAAERAAIASETTLDPVLTYLANTIRSGDRQVPYSLVTAFASPEIDPALRARRMTAAARSAPSDRAERLDARQLAVKPG